MRHLFLSNRSGINLLSTFLYNLVLLFKEFPLTFCIWWTGTFQIAGRWDEQTEEESTTSDEQPRHERWPQSLSHQMLHLYIAGCCAESFAKNKTPCITIRTLIHCHKELFTIQIITGSWTIILEIISSIIQIILSKWQFLPGSCSPFAYDARSNAWFFQDPSQSRDKYNAMFICIKNIWMENMLFDLFMPLRHLSCTNPPKYKWI